MKKRCHFMLRLLLALAGLTACATYGEEKFKKVELPTKFDDFHPKVYVETFLKKSLKKNYSFKKREEAILSGNVDFIVYSGSHNMWGYSMGVIDFSEATYHSLVYANVRFSIPQREKTDASKIHFEYKKLKENDVKLLRAAPLMLNYHIFATDGSMNLGSTWYNPSTFFEELRFGDEKGNILYREKRHYSDESGLVENLTKSFITQVVESSKEKGVSLDFDPYTDVEARKQYVELLKTLLASKEVSNEYKAKLVKTVGDFFLTELLPSLRHLDEEVPAVAKYVKEELYYGALYKKYPENEEYSKKWTALYERYNNDGEQILRSEIDSSLALLSAMGNPDKIKLKIRKKAKVEPLIYHLYKTAPKKLIPILKFQIERNLDSAWALQQPIHRFAELNSLEMAKWVDTLPNRSYVLVAPYCSEVIREHTPEKKLKLQKALVEYFHTCKNTGLWRLDGLEALVPEGNPHYFQRSVVEKHIGEIESRKTELVERFISLETIDERLNQVRASLEKTKPAN